MVPVPQSYATRPMADHQMRQDGISTSSSVRRRSCIATQDLVDIWQVLNEANWTSWSTNERLHGTQWQLIELPRGYIDNVFSLLSTARWALEDYKTAHPTIRVSMTTNTGGPVANGPLNTYANRLRRYLQAVNGTFSYKSGTRPILDFPSVDVYPTDASAAAIDESGAVLASLKLQSGLGELAVLEFGWFSASGMFTEAEQEQALLAQARMLRDRVGVKQVWQFSWLDFLPTYSGMDSEHNHTGLVHTTSATQDVKKASYPAVTRCMRELSFGAPVPVMAVGAVRESAPLARERASQDESRDPDERPPALRT